MFTYKTLEKTLCVIGCIILICFSTLGRAEHIVSLRQMNPDKACGPRCLLAIMQSTGAGNKAWDLEYIYKIIGKKMYSVTNFKDIAYAARQLGFSAEGYKLKLSDLKKMKGYFILPIGIATGTAEEPLHFILASRITNEYVVVIDTKTLTVQELPTSDLKEKWKGHVLVISTHNEMPLIQEPDNAPLEAAIVISGKDNHIKDFGLVESGSLLEHTFEIGHETDKICDAKIVQKSCSCLTAALGKNTNGRTILTMKLNVDKPAWQEASAIVSLEPMKNVKYTVRAYGSNSYQTTPKVGHIEAPNGGIIKYPVTVAYFTDVNSLVKFNSIESSIPNLKTGSVECEETTKRLTKSFTFQIPLVYDVGQNTESVRVVNDNVRFVLDTTKGQRFIPFKLSVKIGTEKFKLFPEKVFIMTSKDAASVQKKVKLNFLSETLPARLAVKLDGICPYGVETDRVAKNGYLINITSLPQKIAELSPGMHKSRITIIPEDLPNVDQITLPVSIFVQE